MENKSGEMSFFVACQNGHTRTAKDLLKLADPRSLLSPWEGRTCFHVAVIAGDPDLLRELAAKIPVQDLIKIITMKDNKGETALHLAVRKNRVDPVKQLVDLDANLCDCTNQEGETPLKLAMVNLLLKVDKVDKHALNSEDKTPFEIAREVVEYQESFRMIRRLADFRGKPKPFMYCAPKVSHEKYMSARSMVNTAYDDRRNAELVVATLLAAMTCAAAFTVPGGFDSESDAKEERGSPILISYISFKLFLIFDCTAFFLSLFVCIMWEMSSELTTGDKMLFMTVNSLVVCGSFAFTTFGFICAVYAMLALEVDTLSWVVLGSLVFMTLCGILAFIRQSLHFVVTRARFHRLCGVSCFFDDIVEKVWWFLERCGLLEICRSGDEVSRDLITGHAKFGGLGREVGSSSPPAV